MAVSDPTLDVENELFSSGVRFVIGCDEVGRGAIAGPVAVGLSVVALECGRHPAGLRDSKLLSEKRRTELSPVAATWSLFSAVGLASAEEIDRSGIMAALGLAGKRALVQLHEAGAAVRESVILLDGSFDWLTPALTNPLRVVTRVKADRDCASVAAASVISKVHRDALMVKAHETTPVYEWSGNKGYGSAGHFDAIRAHGATDFHRRSWLGSVLS